MPVFIVAIKSGLDKFIVKNKLKSSKKIQIKNNNNKNTVVT